MQIGNGKGFFAQFEALTDQIVTLCGGSRLMAMLAIVAVLDRAPQVKLPRRGAKPSDPPGDVVALGDDVILPCTLCEPEWIPWWQENYGIFWQIARTLHCGPLGNDCPGFE